MLLRSLTLSLSLATLLPSTAATAQVPSANPGSGPRKEFRQAAQISAQRDAAADRSAQDIAELTQARERWQREADDVAANLASARARLQAEGGDKEALQREITIWEERGRTAAQQLATTGERLRLAQQAMTGAVRNAADADVLVVGDTLEIVVMGDDTFNGLYPIRRGGYILIPRAGRIQVAGKDLPGAEAAIQEALEKNNILRGAKVIAERPAGPTAAAAAAGHIYLAGEFNKPGPWAIPANGSTTLLTTILQSGGTNDSADLTRVRLLRLVEGQQLVEYFDVDGMLKGKNLTADVPLKASDIIVVPAMANLVYVTGNVRQPGIVKLPANEELKAYGAILRSGGFSRFANEKKVYILRDKGGGAKETIPVNIRDVQKGSIPDVPLQPNDIIVVPESFFSF